jgi:TRAP-type mannitol/chloroaromatic compound transport system permease small subunit
MDKFATLVGRLSILAGQAATPLTAIITLLVLYEVLVRYLLSAPTSWTAEVENYLQIGLVMLGGGYGLYHGGHVRVDVLHRNFSPRAKAWVEIVTCLVVWVAMLPIIYYGVELAWEAFDTGQTSVTAAEIVLWPSMACVPVGAGLVLLQALANALKAAQTLGASQPEGR